MHPRNIYKNRVDYQELYDKYPEFAKVIQLVSKYKLSENFQYKIHEIH
jgi:hypothetical protein